MPWSRQDRMTWDRVVTEDIERNEEIQDLFERKERDRKITERRDSKAKRKAWL